MTTATPEATTLFWIAALSMTATMKMVILKKTW